ncbi:MULTISPECIES: ATP-dependent DNA helicase RecQ [Muribaculum]|uniref:RecQ family ATP-dependent DNA helicase n=3 Tax=Muribaculaceae TaxID=2005473 RepID=UPI000F4AAAEF|nr:MULTISPECIES: ATP-dependent DNA helicase RecQ [Muribaculum]MCX4277556.1 RecQ family ATP-dependent DNA helicase [Muribaculum sp.]ROT14332.1 RecQ family ATP-dependent DNA helicase [Muribaculaceae bacterium Isolate-102 (HZI)]
MKRALIHDILKRYWGYDSFRPRQEEIIMSVLDGRDTLGLLPTGGGKSLTFQVPAMVFEGITVVVTPLISLMKDQVDNLRAAGIRAVCLHSGLSRAEHRLALDRCRLGKAKLMYVSPEKLQSATFIDQLRSMDVSFLVVDEAHCISQWGYDFRPSYLKISLIRELFHDIPVLALTASATPVVVDDIMDKLGFKERNVYARSFSRDNLSYIVRNDFDKERRLISVLTNTSGSAIVYVRSRRRTREIADMLVRNGISADYYHAGLDATEKNEKQNNWKTDGVRVMVATNAFGMGIDKPDVRTVVHYDIPSSLEEYYQEAGRAGRDGKEAFAVLLVSRADKGRLTRMLSEMFPPKDFIRRVYELAGNFVNVAVGDGYNSVYEFNFALFLKTYDLPPLATRSAMRLLTQAQYFEFVEEVTMQSRVMITANKSELYSVKLDEAGERVFNMLLRSYTGLFADFVYINESVIARRADVDEQKVYETMLQLSRMHILQYVPRKSTPYLYYTTSRELPKYIDMPRSVYEEQYKRLKERIEAMKRFSFGDDDCRVNVMLRYFGEKPEEPCGKCDVCRTRKRNRLTKGDRQSIRDSIIYMVGNAPRTLDYIVAESRYSEEDVIEAVRSLLSSHILSIDDSDMISLTRKF